MSSPAAAILYREGQLHVLDQVQLPLRTEYLPVCSLAETWQVIKDMQVRGAPAIAIVGCLGLAVVLRRALAECPDAPHLAERTALDAWLREQFRYLVSARPTAVNLAVAAAQMDELLAGAWATLAAPDALTEVLGWLERQLPDDVAKCQRMGQHGADRVQARCGADRPLRLLTHCNTGSLATGGYGTALGVVRALAARGALERCYCTETRPYNQGARLTAYELMADQLPCCLITDSMAAAAVRHFAIDAVLVGADRIAANGDTANKIGTFQLALVAAHLNVPFFVVAPCTTVDLALVDGGAIEIEQRPAAELTCVAGQRIACPDVPVWNPAFDVTPAAHITAIVTEEGAVPPSQLAELVKSAPPQ